ncbi:beta-xylosidase [Paenibacillus endophyticus]|uniref:Beta-xylosidase n=1 Tax=Paenibacillus endophyticus TaxID=1294268 RepID=A0A7W5CCY2_9BACL|nr:glycoside hydrolase family 43 protein [Paenibacillus endophyticus]MBB3155421.1 beta-xylosidase [Paenibacillus endophyticus]
MTMNEHSAEAAKRAATNPIAPGWYADPEARTFEGRYWIYPTYSAEYDKQTFFDAFYSDDLITWTKAENILDIERIEWAKRALWAPSTIERNGRYYLYFCANDIQSDHEYGGIGVAVSSRPEGPYYDAIGKPLIDRFHFGAQPIDPHVFIDDDGTAYLYYGGWGHCNVVKLNEDMVSLDQLEDGSAYKEITPQQYVEGPCMMKRDGLYYFMWAEGGWGGPDYSVAYACSHSPLGPFERVGKILQQDPDVATGAGHHGVFQATGSDDWYIAYHRRPLTETDRNHRVLCVDRMRFSEDGTILPVTMT